jgi:glutamyl-tRNA synthetase
VDQWRAAGIEPMAVLSLLARLGTSQPIEPVFDPALLVAGFDLAHFGRAPARFDPQDLAALSARLIHQLPFEAVAHRLPGVRPDVWAAVSGNLARLTDAQDWQQIIEAPGGLAQLPQEAPLLAAAAEIAAGVPWDDEIWSRLTTDLKARTGAKGRALFLPLRLALTGRESGPEMAALLPLIGRERALARLRAAAQ